MISLISQLDSITYGSFGFYQSYDGHKALSRLWRESWVFDSTFLIDNVERLKLNEALITFCLQENDETKVIEIKNNGQFQLIFSMKTERNK